MHISVTKETGYEENDEDEGLTPHRKVKKRYRFVLDFSLGSPAAKIGNSRAATKAERLKDRGGDGAEFKDFCCFVCGKTRSDSYHRQHRVRSGEAAIPSLCRGCRRDRKVRIADRGRGRGEKPHRRVTELQAHVDNREWCSNCGVLRSEHYHKMYLSGNLPPWSDFCGKCKKNVKDDGLRELPQLLFEGSTTSRRSSKKERRHVHRDSEHRSRNRRSETKHHSGHEDRPSNPSQPAARDLQADGDYKKNSDLAELTATPAMRDDSAESPGLTKDYQGDGAQDGANMSTAKEDTESDGRDSAPSKPQQSQDTPHTEQYKADVDLESSAGQAKQPLEKDKQQECYDLPSATAKNNQQREKNQGCRLDSRREGKSTTQPQPQPQPQPQEQHRKKPKPRHTQRMGISDMYWASVEGARESAFAGAFGFPAAYEYDCSNNCDDYDYYHCDYQYDQQQQCHGTASGFSKPFPAGPAPGTADNYPHPASPFSPTATFRSVDTTITASSASRSASQSDKSKAWSTAASSATSPDRGHLSAASSVKAQQRSSSAPDRADVPPFFPTASHRRQRTTSAGSAGGSACIWEVDSVEADKIEEARARRLGGAKSKKGKGKDGTDRA